jgi:CRISPR-associated endoribonuclease Cas6
MLLSMVWTIRPTTDVCLPMTMGKAVHACFLRLVSELDKGLSEKLHRDERQKPFTTSPLQGPFVVQKKQLHLKHDQQYWLRFTSLETELSKLLLSLEAQPPRTISLLGAEFAVLRVSSRQQTHTWARRSSYEELQAVMTARKMPLHPRVNLEFLSPTAFHSPERTILLPLPQLVFASLGEKWNRFAPFPLERNVLDAITVNADISRYNLATKMMHFGAHLQLGFVGKCEFVVRRNTEADVVRGLQLLSSFAFFAGIGYLTTMGMGQTRRIAERL